MTPCIERIIMYLLALHSYRLEDDKGSKLLAGSINDNSYNPLCTVSLRSLWTARPSSPCIYTDGVSAPDAFL